MLLFSMTSLEGLENDEQIQYLLLVLAVMLSNDWMMSLPVSVRLQMCSELLLYLLEHQCTIWRMKERYVMQNVLFVYFHAVIQ